MYEIAMDVLLTSLVATVEKEIRRKKSAQPLILYAIIRRRRRIAIATMVVT